MSAPFKLSILLVSVLVASFGARAGTNRNELWYQKPAANWNEALPVGNGRMGAMIFGGIPQERIQFNECTLWTGKPHEYQHEGAVKFLPILRELCNESRQLEIRSATLAAYGKASEAESLKKAARAKQAEAEAIAQREFMSLPLRQKAYQPFGDMLLSFDGGAPVSGYRRSLDLETGIASVRYTQGDTTFTRQCFATFPDNVIVWRIASDKPGRVGFTVRLTSPHKSAGTAAKGNDLALFGQVTDGETRFEARAKVRCVGGKVTVSEDSAKVEAADSAVIILVPATSFKDFSDVSADPAARAASMLKKVGSRSFDQLLAKHLADYQPLFRRVTLDLGQTEDATLPTDERIRRFSTGNDPDLAALVFQYGRYLLIASSRAGGQPANLQGIWNESLTPSWDSKWTVNINTEMNYWPAEVANLAECTAPLFDLISDCAVTGRKTAKAHYGLPGWVLHHNTDLWRGTAPINSSTHGIWPTGGAWLCQHLWEHWLYSGDKTFLSKQAYPLMKEAALFFTGYLFRDPITGKLISGPSNSPEQGGLVNGPAMDHQIIRALFANTAQAARILGRDAHFAQKLDDMRKEIAPDQTGRHGQLQEWIEDKDDPNNKHRHLSHLWAVYPGSDITPEHPYLFKAARQSLLYRGDEATGWSMGWKLNLWARFLDGDHANVILKNLFRPPPPKPSAGYAGGLYPNLFDAHPPFQIDGNFGACAGIAEMLLQSHTGEIVLLPALPSAWPSGSVTGLRARAGFTVDFRWENGRVAEFHLRGKPGEKAKIRVNGQVREVRAENPPKG